MKIGEIPLNTPFLYKQATDCNHAVNEAMKMCYSVNGKSVYIRTIHPVAYGEKSYISFTWLDVSHIDDKWVLVDYLC